MAKKDNQILIIGGLGVAGLAAYMLLNKKQQPQAPQQPIYVPQYMPQPTYAPRPAVPAPTPSTRPTVAQKASGILDLASKGISVISNLFGRRGTNGLGNIGEGYYIDKAKNAVVITDPELYEEVRRQADGLNGFAHP